MKSYPSIQNSSRGPHQPCYGFIKLDGSNIRIEFNHKKGFSKFGSRTQLIDTSYPVLGKAIPLFMEKYATDLEKIFKKEKLFQNAQNITLFAEFFGEGSFAGQHLENVPYDIVLFDVNVHKQGFLSPKEFLDYFGHLPVQELVYQGNCNNEFINSVKNETINIASKYPVKTRLPEGVVVKGGSGPHKLWMLKIKTDNYRNELEKVYADRWENFW